MVNSTSKEVTFSMAMSTVGMKIPARTPAGKKNLFVGFTHLRIPKFLESRPRKSPTLASVGSQVQVNDLTSCRKYTEDKLDLGTHASSMLEVDTTY